MPYSAAKPRILLTSVYKPYAVEDSASDDTTLLMELFHNQVTRGQELFSFRMFHPNMGLHVIAQNIKADSTVLDFPSLTGFVKHLCRRRWDYVGISFIMQNVEKAKIMCSMIRRYAPQAEIIAGGFGTSLHGIENMLDADHVCRGEGVRFMRRLLGQDEEARVHAPEINQQLEGKVMGIPLRRVPAGGLPVTLGCTGKCDFCVTSSYYRGKCIHLINSGTELYDTMERMSASLKTRNFILFDENFLLNEDRAREYLDICRQRGRQFILQIFSSADAVSRFTPVELVEMGVDFCWIGIEGKYSRYRKNRNIDLKALIDDLQRHGISVLASGILFIDSHNPSNIDEEIAHICSHNADFIQFMQYGPIPDTPLYRRMKKQGRVLENKPPVEWTGQGELWYTHPHFTAKEGKHILDRAFSREYESLGPSLVRQAGTKLRGYRTLAPLARDNELIASYRQWLHRLCMIFYPMLYPAGRHVPTQRLKERVASLRAEYAEEFGSLGARGVLIRTAAEILSEIEKHSLSIFGDRRVPKTVVTHY